MVTAIVSAAMAKDDAKNTTMSFIPEVAVSVPCAQAHMAIVPGSPPLITVKTMILVKVLAYLFAILVMVIIIAIIIQLNPTKPYSQLPRHF